MGAVDLVVQVESPAVSVASRPPAGRSRRPPGRRGHPGRAVPQVPRRPRPDRRRRRADAGRAPSSPCRSRPTRSTSSPSRSSPCAPSTTGPSTTSRRSSAGPPRSPRSPARDPRVRPRHARRPLPQRRVRRAAPAHRLGPRHRRRSPAAAAPSGSPSPPAAPSPTAALYAVFLASGEGPGRRVGELDEEMVYESRVGDVFTLGTSTWRIEDITHDRVLVTPAPGLPGQAAVLEGRPAGPPGRARARPSARSSARSSALRPSAGPRSGSAPPGSTSGPTDNLLGYLDEQKEATGHVPDDRTIVVERFRDELGDWRVAIHSPFGGQVHAPWALCVSARMRERFGVDVQAMHGDDGIVFRLPDLEFDDGAAAGRPSCSSWSRLDPDEVHDLVTARDRRVGAVRRPVPRVRRARPAAPPPSPRPAPAAVAAAPAGGPAARGRQPVPLLPDRPRGRARVRPGRLRRARPRRPDAAASAAREVSRRRRRVAPALAVRPVAALRLRRPVPLRGRLAAGRAARRGPLPRPQPARRAARPRRGARRCATCSTPSRSPAPRPSCSGSTPERGCSRRRGHRRPAPGARPAAPRRHPSPGRGEGLDPTTTSDGRLVELEAARRVIRVRVAGEERWAAIEDAARLRDALGAPLPVGVPQAFLEPVPDPLGDLVARYARTHGPFPVADASPPGGASVPPSRTTRCAGWSPSGRVVEGELLPTENGGGARPRVLRRRGAAAAAPPLARCAARRGRAGHRGRARRVPAAVAGRRRRAARARRAAPRRRAAQPAPSCRPAPSRPWCCRPGSPTTPPRCSTS